MDTGERVVSARDGVHRLSWFLAPRPPPNLLITADDSQRAELEALSRKHLKYLTLVSLSGLFKIISFRG